MTNCRSRLLPSGAAQAIGAYLYLAAIDGRQSGYSEGVVMTEAADIMLNLGAWMALNVDGGGSTTMVRSDDHGGATVLNRPSNTNNALRNVSNSLGVYALPLAPVPVPLPAAWLLFAPALLALKQRKRRALLH